MSSVGDSLPPMARRTPWRRNATCPLRIAIWWLRKREEGKDKCTCVTRGLATSPRSLPERSGFGKAVRCWLRLRGWLELVSRNSAAELRYVHSDLIHQWLAVNRFMHMALITVGLAGAAKRSLRAMLYLIHRCFTRPADVLNTNKSLRSYGITALHDVWALSSDGEICM